MEHSVIKRNGCGDKTRYNIDESCQGRNGIRIGSLANKCTVSLWGDGNVLELDDSDGCTTPQLH